MMFPSARAELRSVDVTFTSCEEPLSEEVLRIVHIELASDMEASAALDNAQVQVECDSDGALVRAQRNTTAVGKRMSFDSLDAATRARLVALGVAELARELARLPAAPPPPPPSVTNAPARPTPAPKVVAPRWSLTVGPTARVDPAAGMIAGGGQMKLERRLGQAMSLVGSWQVSSAQRSIEGGKLRWNHAALSLGARAYANQGTLRIYGEAALALGIDQLAGTATDRVVRGASFEALHAAGLAVLGAQYRWLRHGVTTLSLDAAYAARRLEAENEGATRTQLGPLFLGASLLTGAVW